MEIAILGHMGRDEAAVDRLEGHKLHVIGEWENPGLAAKARASGGGSHIVDSIENVELVADYVQALAPDMFLTNFDAALAAGVVDAIERRVQDRRMPRLWIPSPNQAAARVESDKFYLRDLIADIDPKYNPINYMVTEADKAVAAIDELEALGLKVAVKPRNPTGGKGVKVQGKEPDYMTHADMKRYAAQVLAKDDQEGVEIQEKMEGPEFTLQFYTDGTTLVDPPVTYDYPDREDGDSGPGTGGTGTHSMKNGLQPFVTQEDYNEVKALMEKLLEKMKAEGLDFKGVLYPTFFKTANGLKIVEINARAGDPEMINILDLMEDDVDFGEVLKQISLGELEPDSVRYRKMASTTLYLMSPDYAYREGSQYQFGMNPKLIRDLGVKIRHAAAVQIGDNKYKTVGSSRSIGLSVVAKTPWDARQVIDEAIRVGFDHPLILQYRNDVGNKDYIEGLTIR